MIEFEAGDRRVARAHGMAKVGTTLSLPLTLHRYYSTLL